jgi:hypothetical protein
LKAVIQTRRQLRGQMMDAEEENKRLQSELAVAEETNER